MSKQHFEPRESQSDYMRKRKKISGFLEGLKIKYAVVEQAREAGMPQLITLDEVEEDAHALLGLIQIVENPYLVQHIKEYSGMLSRCKKQLGSAAAGTVPSCTGKEAGELFKETRSIDDILSGRLQEFGVNGALSGSSDANGLSADSEASSALSVSSASAELNSSGEGVCGNVIPLLAYRHSLEKQKMEKEGRRIGAAVNASPSSAETSAVHAHRFNSREAQDEARVMHKMDDDFARALEDILLHRYEQTLAFGADFDCNILASYLKRIAGDELYLDPLFSMAQQYALADAPVVNMQNLQIESTGFHLALIGDPGTGKTFAIKELIVGNEKEQKPAHGLVGRNKVLGTVSAAAFVRFAEAYAEKKMNFIVEELGSWLGYAGVFDLLKRIMEDGVAEHRVKGVHIGPYRFSSFFSVNYNPGVKNGEVSLPTNDPNFKAVIDRMVNHAQWQTESRYDAVAENQMRVWEGTTTMDLSRQIQDHLMMVYAAQTRHPLVASMLPQKPIVATGDFFNAIRNTREVICEQLRNYGQHEPDGSVRVPFSARIEKTTLKIAAAMSMMEYFRPPAHGAVYGAADSVVAGATPSIEISKPATDYALHSMIQQAALRTNGAVDAAYTRVKLGLNT